MSRFALSAAESRFLGLDSWEWSGLFAHALAKFRSIFCRSVSCCRRCHP
jgi:hypothetical protein